MSGGLPQRSRALTALAALLLLGAYVLPLWRVRLIAPQYPEGIGMYIHVNDIRGATEFDLANINGLNHYIGMKPIAADAIPELRVMPWLLGALVAGGLGVAAVGRRRALFAWIGAFAALGLAGLADFWRWGYAYGHELDPQAIIRIPGASYQPPLIGTKQLLNFTAESWPASGGLLAGAAFVLAMTALIVAERDRRRVTPRARETARGPRVGGAAAVRWAGAALLLLLPGPVRTLGAQASGSSGEAVVVVTPGGAVRTLGEAVRRARPGGRVVVEAGMYREATIVVDRPLTIEGRGWPTIDGEGQRELMVVRADDVTVRGLRFVRVGAAMTEDRAALRVNGVRRCGILGNRFEDTFFGVYLARVDGCRVEGNVFTGPGARGTEATTGNAIHLWSTRDVDVVDNRIAGHRDGIYFEFVRQGRVHGNLSEGNLRYGLHFMYSDSCQYVGNTFRRNGAGVAVMYARVVTMTGNQFADNRGASAYGLLLKEITEAVLASNTFARNTVGLLADGATRPTVERNRFADNGWGVRLLANVEDGRFLTNDFVRNSFDVSVNWGTGTNASFVGNYFDAYRGYDLDRDGTGDVPHRPVRLFSLLVARYESALVLQHSAFVSLLDGAERALPSLTPVALLDPRPAMHAVAGSTVPPRASGDR